MGCSRCAIRNGFFGLAPGLPQMHVHIHQPRDQGQAPGIRDPGVFIRRQVFTHRQDFVIKEHICLDPPATGNHRSIAYQPFLCHSVPFFPFIQFLF